MQISTETMQPTSSGPDLTTLAAVALVIVIIAALAFFAMKKRGKTGKK